MWKKNQYYFKTTLLIFGLNALIYFAIKLLIDDYNLIGFNFENKIPFIKEFVWIYNIWYPFQILSLYLIFKYNKNQYLKTISALIMGLLISYMFFIVYPTIVNRPLIETSNNITEFILYLTYKYDYPVNCFPSVHCLICFIMLFSINKDLNLSNWFKTIIIILNLLIIASTLLIKQHVLIDVIGALIISVIVYYLINKTKYLKNIQNKMKYQLEKSS